MFDRVFDFVIQILGIFHCWVVIDVYERGVLLRFGRFIKVLEPGFHWTLPLHIDRVLAENIVARTERISSLAATTADGKTIGFDVVILYNIEDIRTAILEVNDVRDAVADACAGIVGSELSKYSWDEIWKTEVTNKLTTPCRRRGKKWGIDIQSVQLVGVVQMRSLRLVTSNASPHHETMLSASVLL